MNLRIGMIGAGYWGPNLIRNFATCSRTEVAAVCDTSAASLQTIRRQFPSIRVVDNVEHLLNIGLDAVAIATPVSTHFPLARLCLNHGLHALVEKPLADTSQNVAQLVDIAARQERVLMVDHTYLFNPAVKKVREIVESGVLGELLDVDGVRVNLGVFQHDVNVIWDLAPHGLSIVTQILKETPQSIAAWGSAHAGAVKDVASINVDYGNHVQATFT